MQGLRQRSAAIGSDAAGVNFRVRAAPAPAGHSLNADSQGSRACSLWFKASSGEDSMERRGLSARSPSLLRASVDSLRRTAAEFGQSATADRGGGKSLRAQAGSRNAKSTSPSLRPAPASL